MSYQKLLSQSLSKLIKEKNIREISRITNIPHTTLWRYFNGLSKMPISVLFELEKHNLININADIFRASKC